MNTDPLPSNSFEVNRGLNQYVRMFEFTDSPGLKLTLSNLNPGSIWFDMGAGTAKALREGLKKNPQISHGVALSLVKPNMFVLPWNKPSNFQYLHGFTLEEFSKTGRLDEFLGKVDVISDYYGPLSYSSSVADILKIYFSLLKPGGLVFFNIMVSQRTEFITSDSILDGLLGKLYTVKEEFHVNKFIRDGQESIEFLINWLRSIEGLELSEVKYIDAGESGNEKTLVLKVKKIAPNILIPKNLQVESFEFGSPSRRVFRID